MQLQSSSVVSSCVNEVIKAVDEGLINARQGLQEIRDEYDELLSKMLFYAQNSIGVLAGAAQLHVGASKFGSSRGVAIPLSFPYIAHGTNNTYEGVANIYNGPGAPGTMRPIRNAYRAIAGNARSGDNAYYTADLAISAHGLLIQLKKASPGANTRHR